MRTEVLPVGGGAEAAPVEWAVDCHFRVQVRGRADLHFKGLEQQAAAEILAQLLRGGGRQPLLPESPTPDTTFKDLMPALLEYFGVYHAESTLKGERGRLDHIAAHFGGKLLRGIRPSDVQDFLVRLRAKRHRRDGARIARNPPASAATRNRYASTLSVAFRVAIDKGYTDSNPAQGIRRQREAKHPVPFISSADVARLLASASDARFRALLLVLADAGLRRSEAARLEWRDVDFGRGLLSVRTSKSGRPRDVPLTSAARSGLATICNDRGADSVSSMALVWPEFSGGSMGAIEARFRRLRDRAGFPRMRLHDLRHAFCSRLAQAGVPIPTIAALAGHESIATTMRYASHVPDDAMQAAIRKLEVGPDDQARRA